MAKWLKDYLSFGSRRVPPQPPKPDYTESEILKAYRVQKNLDFEDPYEDAQIRARSESAAADLTVGVAQPAFGSPLKSASLDMKAVSPKHRLIKFPKRSSFVRPPLRRELVHEDARSSCPNSLRWHAWDRGAISENGVGIHVAVCTGTRYYEMLERFRLNVVPSAPAAGDTDYSDPFDARLDARSDSELGPAPPENNGYMEPYEAQRVIAELQRVPAAGRSKGGVQLYDTPYEERGRGAPAEEGRESRLPQDDERPADEYDQPWEWKKDHISKAFAGMTKPLIRFTGSPHFSPDVTPDARPSNSSAARVTVGDLLLFGTVFNSDRHIKERGDLPWPPPVGQLEEEQPPREPVQFESTEWERSSSPTERHRLPRTTALAAAAAKLRKAVDPHVVLGERVDPTLCLEKQVWYHGALSRSEAEALLSLCKECSYLVRNSQTNRSDYSLSLRSCQGFMHMKFTLSKEGKYILGQNSPPFDTIPEVVHYYTTHKLPIRGAEHLSLLFPVLVQTL
ncbi:SH2 domain-containing adapter protein D-like [Scleropages formosus]|uniref:SH2 domain-containing adapter protein D-like n=1 Tax=Scleropages formosus TaxID=113540 RepID=A0A0P7XBK3_SCLFO|nr:SH2 domain-containing adapter protein D-like [Scleropages formosus]